MLTNEEIKARLSDDLQVGDRVRIRAMDEVDVDVHGGPGWNSHMIELANQTAIVRSVERFFDEREVRLENIRWAWHESWLEKL